MLLLATANSPPPIIYDSHYNNNKKAPLALLNFGRFEIFYYYSHSIVPGLCVSFLLQHNKMPLAYQVKTHLLSPSSGCQKLGLRVAGFSRVLQECNQGVSQVAFSSGALCAFFGVFRLLAESSSLYLKDRGACFLDDCWLGVS